jgi:glycosyltransferase involved in cell wall biosynthesis
VKAIPEKMVAIVRRFPAAIGETLGILRDHCCAVGAVSMKLATALRDARDLDPELEGLTIFGTIIGVESGWYPDRWIGPGGSDGLGGDRWNDFLILGWIGSGSPADDRARGFDLISEVCRDPDLKDRVVFAPHRMLIDGRLPHQAMRSIYRRFDIYLCMSKTEGGGLPMLEVGACGIPVISTDVGIADRLIVRMPESRRSMASALVKARRGDAPLPRGVGFEGVNGILLRERSVSCLRAALLGMDRSRCMVLGRAMRMAILRDWDWEQTIGGWDTLIRRGLE